MKFGRSRTSGFSVRTQSPPDSCDGLILGGGEPDVFVVIDDPAAILELFQDVDRTIGRVVIDDNDFAVRIVLGEDRFEAAFNELSAVLGHYRDGDVIVQSHQ